MTDDLWRIEVVKAAANDAWPARKQFWDEELRYMALLAEANEQGKKQYAADLQAYLDRLRRFEAERVKDMEPAIIKQLDIWREEEQERDQARRDAFVRKITEQVAVERERKLSAARQKLAEAQREIVELEGQE